MSEDPAYYISNLSQAMKRPESNNPIYTALHGPPANGQDIRYMIDDRGRTRVENDEMKRKWKVPGALYLYHGERYCVERRNDANRELFSFDRDASKKHYPVHQKTLNTYYGSTEGAEFGLRNNLLKTLGMPQLPVKTLFARNIVPNASNQN